MAILVSKMEMLFLLNMYYNPYYMCTLNIYIVIIIFELSLYYFLGDKNVLKKSKILEMGCSNFSSFPDQLSYNDSFICTTQVTGCT